MQLPSVEKPILQQKKTMPLKENWAYGIRSAIGLLGALLVMWATTAQLDAPVVAQIHVKLGITFVVLLEALETHAMQLSLVDLV